MIFAIKPFETHDGDGIRTTVFFKGCPLRCKWCHNPESFSLKSEMFFSKELCVNCMKCTKLCAANVSDDNRHRFLREDCSLCGKCVEICPREAFKVSGSDMSPDEIAKELLKDEIFMKGSGGGATFSGGEPLLQVDLCVEVAKILKERDINIAVDTCGFVPKEAFDKIIPYTDTFLFDVKAIDEDIHIKCTGASNKIILENLLYLDSIGKDVEIRIPYIPNYNDSQIEKIARFLAPMKHITKIRLLAYHNDAGSKYEAIGMKNTLPERLPTDAEIQNAADILKRTTDFVVLY